MKYIKNLQKYRVEISPLKFNGRVLVDGAEKANVLNNQFYSVFTNEDLTNLPPVDLHPSISLPDISFSIDGIVNLLQGLDNNKSPIPDGIPAIVLKMCAWRLLQFATDLYTIFVHFHNYKIP